MSTRYAIESPSHLKDVPSFFLRGMGMEDKVPHWGMGLDRAQLFPDRDAAETFARERLPHAKTVVVPVTK